MKQAKVLTDAELKRVLAICVTMQNGKRNRLMLLLSHYAGLRVGEIASLKWADVLDRELKPKAMFYLKAENTKAKEARQVHLNAKLQRELATYWAQLDRWKNWNAQSSNPKRVVPSQLTAWSKRSPACLMLLGSTMRPHTAGGAGSSRGSPILGFRPK